MTEFVSAILGPLVEKLASSAVKEIQLVWGVEDDREKLKSTLETIQKVLADAERKQTEKEAVRLWLSELKDFCYDAEDVLDEFEAKPLRRRARLMEHLNFKRKSKMAHKMKELRKRLDGINEKKTQFNLLNNVEAKTIVPLRETHSFVLSSSVIGRNGEKESIIEQLIGLDDGGAGTIPVIPIIGMGGTGKTTLAQFVYNDDRVKNHFDPATWVSMPVEYEAKKVIRDIIKSLNSNEKLDTPDILQKCLRSIEVNSDTLDILQMCLRSIVENKRCLFVMDDVWELRREDWVELRGLLGGASKGSKVIVTSRNESIAKNMGTVPTLHLAGLSEKDSRTLFMNCAFDQGQEKKYLDLMVVGEEIVRKCGGNPKAVKALGSLLYKTYNRSDWEYVRDSEVWQLQTDIVPLLRISYDLMPSHLKQCFAFCSIFPKSHEFCNLDLIELWMSNGFIQPTENNQELEEIGRQYVEELRSRSFFDVVQEDYPFLKLRMHDLIHELAVSVAQTESSNLEERGRDVSPRTRHISLLDPSRVPEDELEGYLSKLSRVRTVLFNDVRDREFPLETGILRFKRLRVLWLVGFCFDLLPSSIGDLKDLRYLGIRRNKRIKKLPGLICDLRNLQCFNLIDCLGLEELPANIKNMISLRVLYITTKQQRLPEGEIGCLTSLRWLFISGCKNLEALFDDIQSLTSLRMLFIYGCPKLTSLPQGVKNLKALEDLSIGRCSSLRLPEGESNELRLHSFRFEHLPEVVSLPGWLEGSASTLQRIRIADCPNLRELPEWLQNCSSLRTLEIERCPLLGIIPAGIRLIPTLEDLSIGCCSSLRLPEGESNELRLHSFRFEHLPEVVSLPGWLEGSASTLQRIRIADCPSLRELPEWLQNCSSLRTLEIERCPRLGIIPAGIRLIPTLTRLRTRACGSISTPFLGN